MYGQKRVFPLVLAGFLLVLLILQFVNDQFIRSSQILDVVNVLFVVMVIMIVSYAVYMLWSRFKG